MTTRVTQIHTYPVKGQPGTDLDECVVEAEGMAGDRRKKAALHLVAKSDAATTRANLVVDISADALRSFIGARLRVGDIVVGITGSARNCPGVYAEVVTSGEVHLGDVVAPVEKRTDSPIRA
ncbi:hypothetical protein BN12_100015 [Nostocoides japonicum T1-X7]|uniref:MOSC domain-containing protein n=1 Tax=Nostocoides japonicum T1-X7 TaxID=1194083 RepID=A0A077LSX1_9MICO|nr:MOSC domain-containing protein [Tetrasphaera japonica]CCH75986.1 hypothetical protein BN12_100015 [Tetrasphaera japonica T1-X7]